MSSHSSQYPVTTEYPVFAQSSQYPDATVQCKYPSCPISTSSVTGQVSTLINQYPISSDIIINQYTYQSQPVSPQTDPVSARVTQDTVSA